MTEGNETKKSFDHSKAGVSDKIALISELEHVRRHALRSAASALEESDDSESTRYLLLAKRAQTLRREYTQRHFGEIKDTDWCLCKSAACIRQIAYEVCEGNGEELKELDDFVDEIWGKALNLDLSDCVACREDRAPSEEV